MPRHYSERSEYTLLDRCTLVPAGIPPFVWSDGNLARWFSAAPIRCGLLLFLLAIGGTTFAQTASDVPEANPGRPTVSTPATLTPVGYLQFEVGGFGATDSPDFSTRSNGTAVVKLTVQSRFQLSFESEPFVHTNSQTQQTKFGDVFAGFQSVLIGGEDTHPTLSVSFLHKFRESGVPEVDFGAPRNSVLLLFSGNLLGFHYDANALANELEEGTRRAQTGQTLSISHPLHRFTVSGEIWHFTQPFARGHAVGNLWAVSYPVRKNLVIDGGFDHGLTSTSTQWEAFVGFTYLLPHRLW